jgi:hypothetical protein
VVEVRKQLGWKSLDTAQRSDAHFSDKDAGGIGSSTDADVLKVSENRSKHNPHHLRNADLPETTIHLKAQTGFQRILIYNPHIVEPSKMDLIVPN